jgi:hypothetical protein
MTSARGERWMNWTRCGSRTIRTMKNCNLLPTSTYRSLILIMHRSPSLNIDIMNLE